MAGVVPLQAEDRHAAENVAKAAVSFYKLHEKKTAGDASSRCVTKAEALQRLRSANADLEQQSAELLVERGTVACEGRTSNTGEPLVRFSRDLQLLQPTPFRLNAAQVESFAERISCPVLVVLGEQGVRYQGDRAKLQMDIMARHAASFSMHKVPGNHHVHMNQPERVAAHLIPFLKANLNFEPSDTVSRRLASADPAPTREQLMQATLQRRWPLAKL